IEELAKSAPEIIVSIEKDLDVHARKEKKIRLEDRKFLESHTADLPKLDIRDRNLLAEELNLAVGRPRMPGYAVYVFLMTRGFLGSLTSQPARRFLYESMSLYGFLQNRGLSMPAVTTILENVNLVSQGTRDLIFRKQIALILREDLDDFKKLTIDSTAVKANSCWPTDARILTGLLMRANRLGQKLHIFGLDDFRLGWVPHWLAEMDRQEFQICLAAGKPKSKGKLKKRYRQLLKRGQKAADFLADELKRLKDRLELDLLEPSRRILLRHVIQQIEADIADANRVVKYAGDRVFKGQTLPSTQKVLSLADGSAAYIQKGSRAAVIGYKPQLVRSANGFVTSLIVPRGNASDAVEFAPAIRDSIDRTGVVAELVSTDDGYASAKGRGEVLAMGVKDISISGAKGKRLTDPDDWQSDVYRNARRERSAVESLMFTIKDGFEFGELGRRGAQAVRAELLEKVLAYNFCRIILIRKRKGQDALDKAA
ncbi:MAG: transposase, partial [Pseudorhodobacter sp.]|nr:transposase [Pseudorhodobacter sp.]